MLKPKPKKQRHQRQGLQTARPPTITASQSPYKDGPLDPEQLRRINAYWRAANYLSVGQIYLCENPLLREPLKLEHVKQLLLGHWGTTPGQNFIYAHLNRVIKEHDLNMIYISGPGHGAQEAVPAVFLPRRDFQPCFAADAWFDS
jgi:phosphoketolase